MHYRSPGLFILLCGLLCGLLLLTACDALPGAASVPSDEAAVPLMQDSSQPPDEVVRSFLDAWQQRDLATMYAYVSPRSRELYPFELFERRYQVFYDEMSLEGITYDLRETRLQGTSAAVSYDATLESPIFGTIEDPDRIMRLVQEEGGWHIAWTPIDILNGFSSDVTLQVQSRFPPRASIYDRDGEPVVQQGGTIVSISVIQQDMANVDDCMRLLAELMLRPYPDIVQQFINYNPDTFFQVGEMDQDVFFNNRQRLNEACAIDDESAGFQKVTQYQGRRYYGSGATPHITGYIGNIPVDSLASWQARGYRSGDIVGLSGLEFTFQDELAGTPERVLRLVEPGGATLRELGGTAGTDPVPIQLTIDRELQYETVKAMNDAYNYALNNWAGVATGSAVVVMDVNTGAILALASYPTYDPNLFNPNSYYADPQALIQGIVSDPRSPLSNKAVQEQYTPGSIYKMITTLTAAAERVFPMDQTFFCDLEWRGQEKFGDAVEFRQDWRVINDLEAAGNITMSQALTASCNPFFWEMGGTMYQRDPDMLATYSEMLGLGSRTGFNILGPEAAGNVAHPQSPTEAINNAIGQGDVQVTVLQMARAVAAIANRGTLYQPWIVQQIGGLDDTPAQAEGQPRVVGELDIPQEAFDVVHEGMCAVPTDPNLGTSYYVFADVQPLPYTSCGKTGTAEAGAPGSGIPPHAWYATFAPREDPEIAIVVVTTNSREGSEVSAPIARRIMDHYFDAPIAPFPEWWEGEYIPLEQPEGLTG